MINESLYQKQFQLLKSPPLFDIEASSACNEACFFCPRSEMVRSKNHMSKDTMKLLANWLPKDATVMFSGLGESIFNPNLPFFIKILKEKGIGSCLISNGVFLDEMRMKNIVDAGIEEVQISLHSLDEAEYQRITIKGGKLQTVLDNLTKLSKIYNGKIRINVVNIGQTELMLSRLESFAKKHNAEYFERRLHNRGGRIDSNHTSTQDTGLCGIHSAVTFITSDGDIISCVNDAPGENKLGNIRDFTWEKTLIWKESNLQNGLSCFNSCSDCDDEYRWTILKQGGVDHR